MTKRSSPHPTRLETAAARCSVAAVVGVVAGLVSALITLWQAAILIGWDAAAICYLAWTWTLVGPMGPQETERHAKIEDGSRRTAEALVLVAGVALLAAVGLVLIKAGRSHGGTKAILITIGVLSVVLAWTTVHTVFTLRYTRSHYQNPKGGVDFNEADPPAYLDFAYLAFTIGMTFQVSDTNLTTKLIRRIALSARVVGLPLRGSDRGTRHQYRGEPVELILLTRRTGEIGRRLAEPVGPVPGLPQRSRGSSRRPGSSVDTPMGRRTTSPESPSAMRRLISATVGAG